MTSGVNAKERFGKQDFVYVAADIPLSLSETQSGLQVKLNRGDPLG
jgi:hypothetical protein